MTRLPSRILPLLATVLLAGCGSGEPPSGAVSERVALARKLLLEAGYPNGKGLPKLEVLYNEDEGHKRIAAAIQEMWRKNLGVEVELRNTEWKVYLDDMSKLRYQIMRRGWIGDYRDPLTFIELFTTHSGNNNTGWSNPEYDRLVKEATAEGNPARRYEIFKKAETLLLNEAPVLPIYFYVTSNCWKEHVKGVHANLLDVHPLAEAYAEGRETLVINNATDVQTLDPTLARGVPEHRVLIGLFEGLTTPDPRTLEPQPGVAARWDISPDGRTYTFHLRDAQWSDGKPVTAHDFVYAWRRILDPSTPTDYAHFLYFVKGAEAFNTRKTADPASVGVRARDDRTLEVQLEHPTPFFLELHSHYAYFPVRRDVVERHGKDWTRPENMVSNGPFRLLEAKPSDSITLEKNPRYWNASKVRQAKVKFLPLTNRSTAWNLYKEDRCDWVTTLPLDQIDEIVKRPDYRGDAYLGTYFYSFNVTHGPLKDPRVRRALSLAVERETIVEKIARQGQRPAYHFVPPAWPDYRSPTLQAKE